MGNPIGQPGCERCRAPAAYLATRSHGGYEFRRGFCREHWYGPDGWDSWREVDAPAAGGAETGGDGGR